MRFKKQRLLQLAVVVLFLLSFSFGLIVGKSQPYGFSEAYNLQDQIHYTQYNSSNLSSIKTIDDANKKRFELLKLINGDVKIEVTKIEDPRFDLKNLDIIEEILIDMDFGVNSIAYLFHPNKSNNNLIIYHAGHDEGFINATDTIQFFLEEEFPVLAFSMPLESMNSRPLVDTRFGKIRLKDHNHLSTLDFDGFSSLKFFIAPIVASLEYTKKYNFDSISMVGLSGGGWTTVIYAALDPGISLSYPVAGSTPFYLRAKYDSWGDYEQNNMQIYGIANYIDLYIMGSIGKGRKQLQIFNNNDSCCYRGEEFESYDAIVQDAISNIGEGDFSVWIDDYDYHGISERALRLIVNDIKSATE